MATNDQRLKRLEACAPPADDDDEPGELRLHLSWSDDGAELTPAQRQDNAAFRCYARKHPEAMKDLQLVWP